MASQLLTVEQAAGRLHVHVKTVRRYIQEGRLKAKRIGKEYRIARTDFDAFAGTSEQPEAVVSRVRHVTVSSIVDVEAISPEEASRVTTMLLAGLNARKGEPDFPRVDSLYYAETGRLRIMITANPTLTTELLRTINALLEHARERRL